MITAVVGSGIAHLLHTYQMQRIAAVFLREARRAQSEDRPDDAMRFLRNYVTLLPENIEGLDLFGQQLVSVDAVAPAYLTLEKVIRLEPERTDTRRTLVTLAMQMGRFPEARANAEELLKTSPKDGEIWEQKGRCEIAQGEYKQARETLQSGIEQAPDRLECYVLLAALLQLKLDSPAEAKACINQMVANNPQQHRAYLKRAEWQMQFLNGTNLSADAGESAKGRSDARKRRLEILMADAQKARELAPEDSDTLLFSIRIASLLKSYEEARKYAEHGLEKFPSESRFYLALDDVETSTSNLTAALDVLRRGTKAAPRNRELQWNFASRLIDVGNESDASALIQQLKSAGYPKERIGFLDARILLRRSQWREAIRLLETIRPGLLNWPDLVKQLDVMLALAYRETDAGDQQLACFRRAVDVDPQWIPARVGLAEALLAANLVRQASEEYRKILVLPNAPPEAAIEFAKTLQSLTVRREVAEQDWSEFDEVLKQVEPQLPQSKWIPILRAEKLAAQGRYDDASRLINEARDKMPDEVDLWIVQMTLAQLTRNAEQLDQLFEGADQRFGENVTLRVVKGRSLIQRFGTAASDQLKKLSQLAAGWSEREKLVFARNFALMFLAIDDCDEAERLGLIGAGLQPGDLSIRMVLFDIALRARRPALMERVLQEVRGITGEGPVWHYGEALNLILRGNLVNDEKSLAKARLHAAKARALRPTWARIPLVSAEIELQRGDAFAATEHLQEAISLGERNPAVLNRAVSLLFSQKRFIEADQVVRLLQERQNLTTGDTIRSASEISMRLNDPTRALELAEQLVRNSNSSKDKVWLSQVLGVMGKSQEAERQIRSVIEADGSAPEPWVVLVQVLARSNQKNKAEQVVAEAERAISADQAPLAIAQCYELLGKIDLARSRYQAALDQAPRNMVFVRRLVDFQMRTGLYAEAEVLLRNVLNRSGETVESDRVWAGRNLSLALTISGSPKQLKEALVLVERNLATGPVSPADERIKALILARQSSSTPRRQAIAILEKLLVRDSETAVEDRYLLSKLYIATGDRSKGRAELRTILASRGDEVRYIAAYLQLILQSGETMEAEPWLKKLQKLAPNDLVTVDFQAQLLFAKRLYPDVIALMTEAVNRPGREKDNPESSLTSLLWGARRFEEFARKLLDSEKTDVAAQFSAKAESLYRQYVQRRPQEMLVLAEFHAHMNRVDHALELMKKHGKESAPERIAAVAGAVMKNLQSTTEQLAQLQNLLQAINKSQGWNAMLSLGTADLMSWRGEYDAALRLYNDVLKRDRHDIVALNNKAVLLAMSGGDGSEAFRLIQLALESGGPEDILIDSRGLIYLATGDPVRALADFELSLKESEDAERSFHAALAYANLKQAESARRALRRAHELGLSPQMLHPLERTLLDKLQASLGK